MKFGHHYLGGLIDFDIFGLRGRGDQKTPKKFGRQSWSVPKHKFQMPLEEDQVFYIFVQKREIKGLGYHFILS